MNKILSLSILASLLLCANAANAADVDLQKKVDTLEARIAELENDRVTSDDTDELEDRIDGIETATLVDKINFGIDFRTRIDFFDYEYAGGVTASNNNVWSNRLRLNMASSITDNMKFTGRLSMYKNWADSQINPFSAQDPMQGRRPSDSTIFVERAYVDWRVIGGTIPLTLTIGRQPSSDGPSHQFKDNTVRKATYSALSFDGAADGIVATVGLGATGIPDAALRIGYGKGFQSPTSTMMGYIGNPNPIADSNVLGGFLDFGLGIDGSLVQLSVVSATDVVSNTTDTTGQSTNTNIGDVLLYTAMVEFTDIGETNLDLFAHYAMSVASPNGEIGNMAMPMPDGSFADMPMGLLTTQGLTQDMKEDKTGNAFWVGARYTMTYLEALNKPRIGLEYNQGSENWFSFTQGSNDLTNKLATRGSAVEAYYIQPINRYANLRVGAQMIDYEYTGSGFQIGAPMKVEDANALDKVNNYYLLFDLRY